MTKLNPNQLLKVPGMGGNDLDIKLSMTGVTLLRSDIPNPDPATRDRVPILDREQGSYKKRYTGGQSHVDCNGKLWLKKSEFLKHLETEQREKQIWLQSIGHKIKTGAKKSPAKSATITPGGNINVKSSKVIKEHRINKTEITNRILVMTTAMLAYVKQNAFLGMLTVSFPMQMTDEIAAQAINTWFTALREKERRVLKNYIWVTERQQNGTIHYHILITNRINIQYANRAMKVILCNLIRDGVLSWNLSAAKRYNGVDLAKKRTRLPNGKWLNGPVTNFVDPGKRKLLAYYITKYVTKNETVFPHAAWGCSRAFSALFTGITCTMQEFHRMQLENYCYPDPVIKNLWFQFFPWLQETGPPAFIIEHLTQLNGYILLTLGFLN